MKVTFSLGWLASDECDHFLDVLRFPCLPCLLVMKEPWLSFLRRMPGVQAILANTEHGCKSNVI